MKEVKVQRFEKGDFVKGKANNGYVITNGAMTRGEVTHVDGEHMKVKILEHVFKSEIGSEYGVRNNNECFELLPKANSKASEDAKLEITVVAEKGSELVVATVKYKGHLYGAHAKCSPDDEFDLRQGAAIALSRALDLIGEVDLRTKIGAMPKEPKKPDSLVKIGDLVRVDTSDALGGLKEGDLAEVIGIGSPGRGGKPFVYVASKTKSSYDGNCCTNPGPGALKQPFTYLGSSEYEILPEQPVRPGKVSK